MTVMFIASGAAGLLFEVTLQRSLTRLFGVSAIATSTVLAAWMAGLALGATVFGRLVDRARHPLRLYAWLEVGIGACALATPFALGALTALTSGLAPSFGLAFAVTLGPTMLMGGTLPAIAKAAPEHSLPRLYAANLLGAALGAGLGAYVALPALGLSGTTTLAAGLNVVAAALGFFLARTPSPPVVQRSNDVAALAPAPVLALGFWSGASTFIAEVTWFHLLGAVIGSSAYAFGLMLALFLGALTLGAWWVGRFPDTPARRALGWAQAIAALSLALTLPLWDRSSALFVAAGAFVSTFEGRELTRALVAVQLIVVPAAALGTTYPLLLGARSRASQLGRAIGGLATANTLGAIVGALSTTFVLIPSLGSRGTLLLLALVSAAVAAVVAERRQRVLALVAAASALLMPPWDLGRLASGTNVYFAETPYAFSKVEWAKESITAGLTSVVRHPTTQRVTLLTNGKFQGNEGGEVTAQRAYAVMPLLASHGFRRALLIGIGTGCSLGTLAQAPFEQIDAIELSADIVDAARAHFASVNDRVLEPHPRVTVHVTDGRNFVARSTQQYDVVTIQLSSIWFAGAADLYNREFYEALQPRLAHGGVVQQWVQLHHMTRRDLATIIATLKAVFPHVLLFFRGNQGLLLASREPFDFSFAEVARRSTLLAGTSATRDLPARSLAALSGALVLDERGVDRLLDEERPRLSTDDNLLLEFSTPRANADDELTQAALVDSLAPLRAQAFPWTRLDEAERLEATIAFLIGRGDEAGARALLTDDPGQLTRWRQWLDRQ